MSDRLIEHLHPDLRPLCKKLIADLADKQITARVIQGFRDPSYQEKLKVQGISKLSGNQSKHCFTLLGHPAAKAFDLGVFNQDGAYVPDGTDIRYTIAGGLWRQYAVSYPELHLVWGGNFVSAKKDADHFEIG